MDGCFICVMEDRIGGIATGVIFGALGLFLGICVYGLWRGPRRPVIRGVRPLGPPPPMPPER